MKPHQIILLSCFFMTACDVQRDNPYDVAEKYWSAIQNGDTDSAKLYISKNSHDLYDEHIKSLEDTSIDNFVVDEAKTTVTTIINPEAESPGDEIIFETRLVLEDNHWKIDLNNTQVPQTSKKDKELQVLAEELSDTMQKNVETMGEAISEGMNILNDALREGSEEMGKSVLETMKELNEKMRESISKMKERRKKKQMIPENTDDESGEGLI